MAETYKWLTLNQVVRRGSDGAAIPNDPGNKDWQQFQTDGGVATAADPPESAAQILTDLHTQTAALAVTGSDPYTTLQRAAALVIEDRLNIIHAKFAEQAAVVAAATTLADLKTRWAAITPLAQMTPAQIVTAIQVKINAGAAD